MSSNKSVATSVASFFIWLLVSIGMLLHFLVIPILTRELAASYVEYFGDELTIQLLLSGAVLVGQVVLVLVALLLGRIKKSRLLYAPSLKLVFGLVASLFALSLSFVALLVWLIGQNTMPPALFGFLVVCISLSAIAGLVTLALSRVLGEATESRLELEGVI